MTSSSTPSRRDFVRLTGLAGATLLIPSVVSCVGDKDNEKDKDNDNDSKDSTGGDEKTTTGGDEKTTTTTGGDEKTTTTGGEETTTDDKDTTDSTTEEMLTVPKAKPDDWDPIDFNRKRGNQGAIPESYLESINGPDGEKKHLGKHLPYSVAPDDLPEGTVAIMWGDPSKEYAKHPNAEKSDKNPAGHWYDWIRIRKATDEEAQEVESKYSAWPIAGKDDTGAFDAQEGEDPAQDDGKNTIYIAKLPDDVKKGDLVRIYAHCLTHGEYVDFMTV